MKIIYFATFLFLICLSNIQFTFGQDKKEQIYNLTIHELAAPDSVVSLLMIEFASNEVEKLTRIELIFDKGLGGDENKQVLDVVHKDNKHFVKLLNQELIEVSHIRFAFATMLNKPSKNPYKIITVRGVDQQGNFTNEIQKERQK
jgi:hypothetical protein